jgi:hypothetical protein
MEVSFSIGLLSLFLCAGAHAQMASPSSTPIANTETPIGQPHRHSPWKDPRPDLMFTVGDSISAGFIATTSASSETSSDSPASSDSGVNSSALKSPEETPNRSWSAVVKGAGSLFDHKDSLSWSSGQNIYSHYIYLRDYLKKFQTNELVVQNVARSGGFAIALDKEADDILKINDSAQTTRVLRISQAAHRTMISPLRLIIFLIKSRRLTRRKKLKSWWPECQTYQNSLNLKFLTKPLGAAGSLVVRCT